MPKASEPSREEKRDSRAHAFHFTPGSPPAVPPQGGAIFLAGTDIDCPPRALCTEQGLSKSSNRKAKCHLCHCFKVGGRGSLLAPGAESVSSPRRDHGKSTMTPALDKPNAIVSTSGRQTPTYQPIPTPGVLPVLPKVSCREVSLGPSSHAGSVPLPQVAD